MMSVLLGFLGFQCYIKYKIFQIRIKATPVKISLNSHLINGKKRYLKFNESFNENQEDACLESIKEEASKLILLRENIEIIKNDITFLISRRDKLISLLNKSIFVSFILGIILGTLFGVYLYFSITN